MLKAAVKSQELQQTDCLRYGRIPDLDQETKEPAGKASSVFQPSILVKLGLLEVRNSMV